jgi:hypothetical protein
MQTMRRKAIRKFATLALLLALVLLQPLWAGRAQADAIDGHWCHADGRLISIAGSRIVTPRGSEISGDYRRHFFTYHVPVAEPAAGTVVFMTQLNEQTIHVRRGADLATAEAAAPETWRRCSAAVSLGRDPSLSHPPIAAKIQLGWRTFGSVSCAGGNRTTAA